MSKEVSQSEHIKAIFEEEELDENVVVWNFRTTTKRRTCVTSIKAGLDDIKKGNTKPISALWNELDN